MYLLFPISLFLSASLLFIMQPMVAKMLLPVYGGTPAVWTVCMLFFQLLLLVSYAYAWGISRIKGSYCWRLTHLVICLVSLICFPWVFEPVAYSNSRSPELEILKTLLFQLGLPLLIIGASAPLLQYAFAQIRGKKAPDPYFLYAASNGGSLLALLVYPWLIERFWGLKEQFVGWNIIYFLYLFILFYLLLAMPYEPAAEQVNNKEKRGNWLEKINWVFFSFIPCSLMLGVTFYISTDIAPTPFFWILPLALYLLSFILTFARKKLLSHQWIKRRALIFLMFPIVGFIIGETQLHALPLITFNLMNFFIMALLCHGELVLRRPAVSQLTSFYFCISLGGVLAGLFNGLIAPRLFSHAYEYPFVILLSVFSLSLKKQQKDWLTPVITCVILMGSYLMSSYSEVKWLTNYHLLEIIALVFIVIWPGSNRSLFISIGILFFFLFSPWFKPTHVLSQKRNFYGVKQVFSQAGAHVLLSHSTVHGFQVTLDKNPTDGARAYYGVIYPVVQRLQAEHESLHAMVLGLGTGMMACQFRAQDKLTMVEIDPQVMELANNSRLFTYLRDCPAQKSLLKNDGLLAVKQVPDGAYQLLVMDAFNSDAIPTHLLTLEAFIIYKKKITSDGVILVNISNRHLNVLPILTGAGRELGMIVLHKVQSANHQLGQLPAEWVLLTTNEHLAGNLLGQPGWRFVAENEALLWTNDYSNLIPLIKW